MWHEVAPALRPYVASMVCYAVHSAPGTHIGVPSAALTLVLPIGAPLDVAWAADPESRRQLSTCLSGLHAAPALIRHDGVQEGVQVGLTPAGSRALLGLPAAPLAGELVELDQVVPQLHHLPERLAAARSWPQRLALVEQHLVRRLEALGEPQLRPELGYALAELTRGVRVDRVAGDIGYSRRHLSTLFRAEYGLTPKSFARVSRFQAVRGRIQEQASAGTLHLASVASWGGYADQAHLTREFKEFTGLAPTSWLEAEFPNFQDTAHLVD